MIGHFEDIAESAIEEHNEINLDYILKGIELFELLDSRIEINPIETRNVLKKIKKTIEKGKR